MNENNKKQDSENTLEQRTTDLEEDMNLAPEHIVDDDMKAGNTRHRWLKISFSASYVSGAVKIVNHQYGRKPTQVLPAAYEGDTALGRLTFYYDRADSSDTQIQVRVVRSGAASAFSVWVLLI